MQVQAGNIVARGAKINCPRIEISNTGVKLKEIAGAVDETRKYRLISRHAMNFVIPISFVHDYSNQRQTSRFHNIFLH